MTTVIVLSALAMLGMLWFFRWRLKRMRKTCALDMACAVAIHKAEAQRARLSAQMTKAELANAKAADKSRDPDVMPPSSHNSNLGNVHIRALIAVALFGGSLFALLARPSNQIGGDSHLVARTNTTAGGVNAVNIPGGASGGRVTFDAKLEQLRSKPNIPAIDYFQRIPVDESRRAEVATALENIVTHGDIDRARVAVRVLGKWGNFQNAPAVERFAAKENGTYRTLASESLAKLK